MKRFALILVLVLSFATSVFAEVSEPFFKMSFASYDQFLGDMKFIGEVASDPAFGTAVELPLQLFLGADFLESLDKKAPVGLWLQRVDEEYTALFLLPVDDMTAVTDLITQKLFSNEEIEMNQGEDGVMEVKGNRSSLFLKTEGKWTFLAMNRKQLDRLPKDGFFTPTDDTFSMTFDMQRLPQEVKDEFLDAFDQGMELSMVQLPNESDEDYEVRKEQGKVGIEAVKQLLEQYQTVTIGARMNRKTKAMEWDIDVQLQSGSSLLKTLQEQKNTPPLFTGFTGKGLLCSGYTVLFQDTETAKLQKKSLENSIQTAQSSLQSMLTGDDETIQENAKIVRRVFQVLKETLEPYIGKEFYRIGMGVQLDKDAKNLAFGIDSTDPQSFQKAFDDLVQIARDSVGDRFQETWVHKNVETVDGITFSTFEVPMDELNSNASITEDQKKQSREFWGDKFGIAMGLGKDRVYLGVGNSPLALLKVGMKETGATSPSYVEMSLRPLLAFIGQLLEVSKKANPDSADDNEKTQGILTLLSMIIAESSDKITIQYDYTDKGIRARLILEEGTVRLIGSARSIYTIMAL